MPNTFFRFRQFIIHQDRTAMKVCTDACLFGAWVAKYLENSAAFHLLDVGAGTGLLSLMLAQATKAEIDAVEADADAYTQAGENFLLSPWGARLHIFHQAIQEFAPPLQYHFVISNPPFYKGDLLSPDEQRNLAMHSTQLGFDDLLNSVSRLLIAEGKAAFLIPFERQSNFEDVLSSKSFFAERKTYVSPSEKHSPFRIMYIVGRQNVPPVSAGIIIKRKNVYTDEFKSLLKPYYL